MTHEWVEQEKKRLAEKFENYPEELLAEWYAIPAEYRDIRLKKYNILPEIVSIATSVKDGTPVKTVDVYMLFTYTDEDFLDFYFKDREELIPAAAKYYADFHKNLGQYYEYLEYGTESIEEVEDKVMEFNGDIVITDPCYLSHNMSNDERMEFELCNIGSHGIVGIESDTYYGDWSCTTFVPETNVKLGEFCADAGMVCVADLNSVLKFNTKYNDHIEKPWCATWIKNFKGTVRIAIDKNKEKWPDYIVHIVGHGANKETGEPIEFDTVQTGL